MQSDPVVLALRAALAAGDSVELRNALGDHLRRQDAMSEALAEFEAALRLVPLDRHALEGATAAAAALGEEAKAAAYRLALGALPAAGAASAHAHPPLLREAAPDAPAPASPAQSPPPDGSPGAAVAEAEAARPPRSKSPQLRLVPAREEPAQEDLAEPLHITFADVGGMDEVKARLTRSFLTPLRNPELYKKFGKRVSGGLVLYGPPGCGKTFLARATAGEIGARFVNVGLSDVLDMWFGESERKLHELFENARRCAPTVMFFDEIDALGQRRAQLKGAAGRTLVNQLLSEMDGFAGRGEGVFFLAATNHPWDLDPALRRPGRFDRLVFVPPPDDQARRQILALKLLGRPIASALDLVRAARATQGFSGADLEALVGAATELAIEESLARGRETPIDDRLIEAASRDIRPSTRPWFETARNYALYANEGGVYDDLLSVLRARGLA
jgi:SpoVK/Ycf46/Vps4 family AAA+-type ATPase